MSWIGINIGALMVKVVGLRAHITGAEVQAHQGRPLEVLQELLARLEFAYGEYFGVCGQRGHISELAATERGLRELADELDAVVSLGGESFLVYTLSGGRIDNVLSHNKCAAGSGEFFVQQIGRMGLAIDEAVELSFRGKTVHYPQAQPPVQDRTMSDLCRQTKSGIRS